VRRYFRVGYGAFEIVLGLYAVSDTVRGAGGLDEPMLKIAVGIYLAIRGMDNCTQWLAPRLPAWVRRLLRLE
jgi:hypothetical protein